MYPYFCVPCRRGFTYFEAHWEVRCPHCGKWARQDTRPTHATGPGGGAPNRNRPRDFTTSASEARPEKRARTGSAPPARAQPVLPYVNQVLPNELFEYILSMLDEHSIALLGMVCRRWKPIACDLLARFIPLMIGHGSTTVQLKGQITSYLTGAHHIRLAVDQFPYPATGYSTSILNHILANKIPIELSLGTPDQATMRALRQAGQQVTEITQFHKMHNKLWVIDHEGVILGSPNVSFSALEGGNLESCIYIRSTRLGALFAKYISLLDDWYNDPLYNEVWDALARYNREAHRTRIALAPVMNITNFVVEQLQGATKIIIRQFLISPKNDPRARGADIIDFLCWMASRRVEIEIYLDHGAYTSQATGHFVQRAVRILVDAGCKVYTQTPVLVVNTGGEKIQHDKLILATLHHGVLRTLIGSAGFTRDVIANNNAENFISTDVEAIHASLLTHHRNTLDARVATTWTHHR